MASRCLPCPRCTAVVCCSSARGLVRLCCTPRELTAVMGGGVHRAPHRSSLRRPPRQVMPRQHTLVHPGTSWTRRPQQPLTVCCSADWRRALRQRSCRCGTRTAGGPPSWSPASAGPPIPPAPSPAGLPPGGTLASSHPHHHTPLLSLALQFPHLITENWTACGASGVHARGPPVLHPTSHRRLPIASNACAAWAPAASIPASDVPVTHARSRSKATSSHIIPGIPSETRKRLAERVAWCERSGPDGGDHSSGNLWAPQSAGPAAAPAKVLQQQRHSKETAARHFPFRCELGLTDDIEASAFAAQVHDVALPPCPTVHRSPSSLGTGQPGSRRASAHSG